uniref:Sulfatase N-terminal domain-containing protein n=1 Tax=Salmo trutta TaxID=8032 RepID=A0A674DXZ2_SALTR
SYPHCLLMMVMRGAVESAFPLLRVAILGCFCCVPLRLIFIMADDQGYGDMVLDQLAGEGVKLENYYVQPICSPSCSQLMTGRYQIHTGLQHSIIQARRSLCLPPDAPTLAERLQEAGYSTHMVGKWHLGFCRPGYLPTGHSFHSFLGSLTGSEHFSCQSCDQASTCTTGRDDLELSSNYSATLYIKR